VWARCASENPEAIGSGGGVSGASGGSGGSGDNMLEITGGGGGDGRPRRRRGTKLAPELNRRLAGDEDLCNIIRWWHNAWRETTRMHIKFTAGSEAAVEALQPRNFSDNELACFVTAISIIVITSGCCGDKHDDGRAIYLRSKLGLNAKMLDPAYVRKVMREYVGKLIAARAELRAGR
jgi:hypothetical protein